MEGMFNDRVLKWNDKESIGHDHVTSLFAVDSIAANTHKP